MGLKLHQPTTQVWHQAMTQVLCFATLFPSHEPLALLHTLNQAHIHTTDKQDICVCDSSASRVYVGQ